MSEMTQLIVGITLFILAVWIFGGGMNSEPNLTDGSNCYTSSTGLICN